MIIDIREKIGEYYKNILWKNSQGKNKHDIFKYYYFFSNRPKTEEAVDFIAKELVEIVDFYEYKILNFIEETSTDKNSIDENYIEALLINFIALNNNESYDSYEFTSYEIIDFMEKLKKKNFVNLFGNFQCGSLLDAAQTLYLYSRSNPQRYLLTNNARAILRESLSNSEFNSLSVEEFNFIHEFNNFEIKIKDIELEEKENLEKLNSLIEKHINFLSI